jgi:hypothetical protein
MDPVLYKKRSKGLGHGMHIWHKRYFVYHPKDDVIQYYDNPLTSTTDESNPPRGTIPMAKITEVRHYLDKKGGKRFDITVERTHAHIHTPQADDGSSSANAYKYEDDDADEESKTFHETGGKRVIALMAQSRDSAKNWVQFLTKAIQAKKSIEELAKISSRNSQIARGQHRRIISVEEKDQPTVPEHPSSFGATANAPVSGLTVNSATASLMASKSPRAVDVPKLLCPVLNPHRIESSNMDLSRLLKLEEKRAEITKNLSSSRRHRHFCPQVLSGTVLNQLSNLTGSSSLASVRLRKAIKKSLPSSQVRSFGLLKAVKKSIQLNKKLFSEDGTETNGTDDPKEASFSASNSNQKSTSDTPEEEDVVEDGSNEEESERRLDRNDRTRAFSTGALTGSSHFEHLLRFDEMKTGNGKFALSSDMLRELDEKLRHPGGGLPSRNVLYQYKIYRNCFSGNDFVSWLLDINMAKSVQHACEIGDQLLELRLIRGVDQSDKETMENSWKVFRLATSFEREMVAKESEALQTMGYWVYLMRDPRRGIRLRTIKSGLRSRHRRFTGAEVKQWLLQNKIVSSDAEASEFLRILFRRNIIWSVQGDDIDKGLEDFAILQFNRDLINFDDETSVRRATLSSVFKAFFSNVGSDKDLLEVLLEEHVRQQSLEHSHWSIATLAREQKRDEDSSSKPSTVSKSSHQVSVLKTPSAEKKDLSNVSDNSNRMGTLKKHKKLGSKSSAGTGSASTLLKLVSGSSTHQSKEISDENELKDGDLEDSGDEAEPSASQNKGVVTVKRPAIGAATRRRSASKSGSTGMPALFDSKPVKSDDKASGDLDSMTLPTLTTIRSSSSASARKSKFEDPKCKLVHFSVVSLIEFRSCWNTLYPPCCSFPRFCRQIEGNF